MEKIQTIAAGNPGFRVTRFRFGRRRDSHRAASSGDGDARPANRRNNRHRAEAGRAPAGYAGCGNRLSPPPPSKTAVSRTSRKSPTSRQTWFSTPHRPISGLSSGAIVFIRGIGNSDFSLTTDPGVGIYVDGVYMSRSAGGVLDVLDIERIEVLRGPAGNPVRPQHHGGRRQHHRAQARQRVRRAAFPHGRQFRPPRPAGIYRSFPSPTNCAPPWRCPKRTATASSTGCWSTTSWATTTSLPFAAWCCSNPPTALDFPAERRPYGNRRAERRVPPSTDSRPGRAPWVMRSPHSATSARASRISRSTSPTAKDDISYATGVSGTELDLDGVSFVANWLRGCLRPQVHVRLPADRGGVQPRPRQFAPRHHRNPESRVRPRTDHPRTATHGHRVR